jgi:PKD repeat protein
MKKIFTHFLHPFGLLLIVAGFQSASFSQDQPLALQLKSGTYSLEKNLQEFIASPNFSADELIEGNYFRILQFQEIPTVEAKEKMKSQGIELLSYLPEKAFFASINENADLSVLLANSLVSVVKIEVKYKLTENLLLKEYPAWALFPNDMIALNAVYFETLDKDVIEQEVKRLNGTVLSEYDGVIQFQLPINRLEQLYLLPHFYFFETIDKEGEPEGYDDVSNHRANYINNPLGVGTSYDGSNVVIMMQDDGPIGPHIDYQGRVVDVTSVNNGNHGDHVAGIIISAGNVDPDGVGNAPGAELMVYTSSNSNYNLVPLLYDTAGMVITSKSYGDGGNAGYTTLARTLDKQCRDYDALVHVFSAGNSGSSDFGYGAGPGWGNITGGHKQGKNVLAVGNLSDTDVLSASSSRGPADDGRLKPDICAVGSSVYSTIDPHTYTNKSGTSMSCPAVAGSLALLYEAYRSLNGGQNPSAALINGAVLNTGEDLGNPGPDFKYGWGRINVRRAYNLIENAQYQNGELGQGALNSHTVTVPAGTKHLRVMVYWTDYEATPNASPALVNDINMTMIGPDATNYMPWVLNSSPNATVLNQDAVPGIDDLNNVEQITVDDPMAGDYIINLNGFDIPQGPQKYYLVYEFVQDDITLTFPIGGESLMPSNQELIRWDAFGDNGNFLIEYSVDAGLNWITIVASAPGTWRSFPWTVPPSILTGKGRVRITRGAQSSMSKDNFSVIEQPTNLNVEWACPNSFNFSWDPIPGAIGYEVFLLGDYYMDSAGYTTTENATVYANSLQTQWVSVRAIGADGAIGKRAIALEKLPSTFGCSIAPPIANFTALCTETGSGSCVRLIDISTNAGQGAAWEWAFPGGNPATSNLERPKVCYSSEGFYDVQLIVKNGVGEDTLYISQFINIRDGADLPFLEDFENGVIPVDWTFSNDGNGKNWELDQGVSAFNLGSNAVKFDNYIADTVMGISDFQTIQVNLWEDLIYDLSFDVAYAQGLSNNDSLYVYASNDCGDSRILLFVMGGAELATAVASGIEFVPTSLEWKRQICSLLPMKGNTSVSFIFENHSFDGNVLYVDNINVQLSEDNFPGSDLTVFPNPFIDEVNIAGLVAGEEVDFRIVAANGDIVMDVTFEAWEGLVTIPTTELAAGVYVLRISSLSKSYKDKLVKIK